MLGLVQRAGPCVVGGGLGVRFGGSLGLRGSRKQLTKVRFPGERRGGGGLSAALGPIAPFEHVGYWQHPPSLTPWGSQLQGGEVGCVIGPFREQALVLASSRCQGTGAGT